MQLELDQLMMEIQRAKFRERRSETRYPFVRPVSIYIANQEPLTAFSKDMSKQGIGIVCSQSWPAGTIATIRIHSLQTRALHFRCEMRWCDDYGKDWYLTGWKFLSTTRMPLDA